MPSYQRIQGSNSGGGGGSVTFPLLATSNGTSSAPAYAFSGATGYGLYYDSTNTAVGIGAAGAQAVVKSDGCLSVGLSTGNIYGSVDRLFARGSNNASSKYSLYLESLSTSQAMGWDNSGTLSLVGTGARILLPGAFSFSGGTISYGNAQAQGILTFPASNTGIMTFTSATGTLVNGIGFSFSAAVQIQAGGSVRSGSATPNSAVVGNVGDIYLCTTGGSATTLWVKESGAATNTGWVGK